MVKLSKAAIICGAASLVAALVVVAIVAYRTHAFRREARVSDAWVALATLPDSSALSIAAPGQASATRDGAIAECKRLMESGPGAAARPWLQLKLAALEASGQQWAKAESTYRKVIDELTARIVKHHVEVKSPAADWLRRA